MSTKTMQEKKTNDRRDVVGDQYEAKAFAQKYRFSYSKPYKDEECDMYNDLDRANRDRDDGVIQNTHVILRISIDGDEWTYYVMTMNVFDNGDYDLRDSLFYITLDAYDTATNLYQQLYVKSLAAHIITDEIDVA
jgi:hypothetical protein